MLGNKHIDPLGNYNLCPPGWTHITQEEFAKEQLLEAAYAPRFIEFRQVRLNKDLTAAPDQQGDFFLSVYLFWRDRWHGFAMASRWREKDILMFKFGYPTEDIVKYLKEELPEIKTDSGWKLAGSSITSRGIRDYTRLISFARKLKDKELNVACEWLGQENCPGYTGVHPYYSHEATYRFATTYDSSD